MVSSLHKDMYQSESLKIDLKGLQEGLTTLEYTLDDTYFQEIESSEISAGQVHVKVEVRKTRMFWELMLHTEGLVTIPCNLCMDDMEQLILAYYEARQDAEISPLLLIPCFVLDFLCIHPFIDGNGRVSRLLTVLLLYLSGYDIVRYISYEGQINKYKESYYEALRKSSEFWHENGNDYVPFIINFL